MKRLIKILAVVNIFTVVCVLFFFLIYEGDIFNNQIYPKEDVVINNIKVNNNHKNDSTRDYNDNSNKNNLSKKNIEIDNEHKPQEKLNKEDKSYTPIWPMEEWIKKDANEFGINTGIIENKVQELKNHSDNFKGLLVIKNGYLVYEGYRSNNVKDELISLKSCTKSVMSILIGNAIKNGIIDGVEQNIEDYFPLYFNKIDDSLKKTIKLKHLLTMTSGIQWTQNGKEWSEWWGNSDRIGYTLNLPMSEKPGERFNYSSGSSHLLSGIITDQSGKSTLEYAKENLFGPLNIKHYKWAVDQKGYNHGNSELFLKMKDMGKIGYLYLRNGNWNEIEVVHEEWVRASVTPSVPGVNYGYSWWTNKIGEDEVFYASGYGGQYIYIYPEEDLVIVMASTITQIGNWPDYALRVIEDFLIPELKEDTNRREP